MSLLKRENGIRKLTNRTLLTLNKPEELLDWVENSLSPENLCCDGEAPQHMVRKWYRELGELKFQALEKMGKVVLPKIGETITFQNEDYIIEKISRVNFVAKSLKDNRLYNLRKTILLKD